LIIYSECVPLDSICASKVDHVQKLRTSDSNIGIIRRSRSRSKFWGYFDQIYAQKVEGDERNRVLISDRTRTSRTLTLDPRKAPAEPRTREKGGLTSSPAATRRGAPKNPAATQNRRAARAPPPVRSTAARSHSVERARAGEGTGGGAAALPTSPAGHSGRRRCFRCEERGEQEANGLGFPVIPTGHGFDPPPSPGSRRIRSDGLQRPAGRTG